MNAHHGVLHPAEDSTSHRYGLLERPLRAVFDRAGVELNGSRSYDPQIHRASALRRVLAHGSLGAGESYVDGDWDCEDLTEFTSRLLSAHAHHLLNGHWSIGAGVRALHHLLLLDGQSHERARQNVVAHYDIGDDLYSAMLGRSMTYSCGYWQSASTLDEAQDAKHDLICRKIGLRRGMRVLDIGCGWGGFAAFAAERYDVKMVGITLSPAQAAYARRRCHALPVEIREQDYRDVTGRFDRVVSVGMFEHVGPRHYRAFFESVKRVLDADGLALIHAIGGLDDTTATDAWMERYIFPNAVIPTPSQVTDASEGLFVLEDWHNFGAFYERTLLAWHANVEAAWPELRGHYGDRFRRMWRYYLLTCAGSFRARHNQLWQFVLSPHGVRGGYTRPCA